MITIIDPTKIKKKRDPGRCFLRAGFKKVGHTKKHQRLILRLDPEDMPDACSPYIEK